MSDSARCPRCSVRLAEPGLFSTSWQCDEHGAVLPLVPAPAPSAGWAMDVAERAEVPMWLPWPLPRGWVVSGIQPVGDDVTGVRAVAVALDGPSPLGGPAQAVLVAEAPGTGFGAALAGLDAVDAEVDTASAPYARVGVGSHLTPMWAVPGGPDVAAFVGEWDGAWLWFLLRPGPAGALLLEQDLRLVDLRELGAEARLLPYGARSTWLPG